MIKKQAYVHANWIIYLFSKFNARVHSSIGNHADSLQSTLYAIYNVIYFAMWSTYLCAQCNTIHRIRFRLTHQAVIEYCKRFTRTLFWSLLCLSFICSLLLFSIFCQGDFVSFVVYFFRIWSFMFRISLNLLLPLLLQMQCNDLPRRNVFQLENSCWR